MLRRIGIATTRAFTLDREFADVMWIAHPAFHRVLAMFDADENGRAALARQSELVVGGAVANGCECGGAATTAASSWSGIAVTVVTTSMVDSATTTGSGPATLGAQQQAPTQVQTFCASSDGAPSW